MKRPHVLAFTSLFRTPNERVRAPFTSEFLRALGEFAEVSLVCPIPWAPDVAFIRARSEWAKFLKVPARTSVDGVDVHYVQYPLLPRLSGVIQPWLEAQAARAAVAAIHARKPVDLVNGRFVFPDGVAAASMARSLHVPLILTALGTDINVYAQQRFKRGQTRRALLQAAHVTAVSPALADQIRDMGVQPQHLSAAVNGIDIDRFCPQGESVLRQRCHLAADRKVLVSLARLSSEKGLNVLLDAISLLKQRGDCDFTTVLIGDGPERAALEQQSRASGIADVVHFAGEIDHASVPGWLRGADAFCLPSFREGTPNVVIEALASGVPVVSTDVGGTPLLLNPDNGRLVPPHQAAPLAEAISEVVHGHWSVEKIRASVSHMSWRSEAQRMMNIIETILSQPARAAGLGGARQ